MVSGPAAALSSERASSSHPERGVTTVEYALMAAIIVMLLVGAAYTLFQAVQSRFDRDINCAEVAWRGDPC